jgi:transposase
MMTQAWEQAMKRHEVILKALGGQITWIAAAEIIGITPRQMRRLKWRYEHGGSVLDRRLGQARNRVKEEIREKVAALYREQYFDFNVKHFHEKLQKEHGIRQSYPWTLNFLHEVGLVKKQTKRDKHRKKRERRPLEGMLIHLDGSEHHWRGEAHGKWDLLATLDDATGEVYSAFFVPEENTASVLKILSATIEAKGIFCSLYTDRASHFVYTPKAGERPSKELRTQCQRALDRLGIRIIAANSPQARGRGERLWKTFQGRLPQELRIHKIIEIEAANEFLKAVFIPAHNQQFKVAAKDAGSAFVPLLPGVDLNKIFSIQHERMVGNDNTISYKKKIFQLPESSLRYSFTGCRVIMHEHTDGTYSVSYGPQHVATYDKNLKLIETQNKPKDNAA